MAPEDRAEQTRKNLAAHRRRQGFDDRTQKEKDEEGDRDDYEEKPPRRSTHEAAVRSHASRLLSKLLET